MEQRQAHYRCQYPAEYASSSGQHPKTVYVREDLVLRTIEPWIEMVFDQDHLDGTVAVMAAAIEADADDTDTGDRLAAARETSPDATRDSPATVPRPTPPGS